MKIDRWRGHAHTATTLQACIDRCENQPATTTIHHNHYYAGDHSLAHHQQTVEHTWMNTPPLGDCKFA